MMRRTLFVITLFFVVAMGNGHAQKALKPVCGDSILVDDFFWYDMLDTVPKLYPDAQPYFFDRVDKLLENPEQLQKDFSSLEDRISLTGCESGIQSLKQRYNSAKKVAVQSMAMALHTRKAQYFDYCERAMYNDIVGAWYDKSSGIDKKDVLQMAQAVPQMMYATSGKDVYMNLFMRSLAHISTEDIDVKIITMTSIPWYFKCAFKIEMDKPEQEFTLHIRVPSWMEGKGLLPHWESTARHGRYQFTVNAEMQERILQDGYFVIKRVWKNGDIIHFDLPAPIVRIQDAHDPSMIALQRGMLVYAYDRNDGFLKPSEGISNKYDQEHDTSFLLPMRYDKQGTPLGEWRSVPYFWNREKYSSLLFVKQWGK